MGGSSSGFSFKRKCMLEGEREKERGRRVGKEKRSERGGREGEGTKERKK